MMGLKKVGLIGTSLSHSLSKILHTYSIKQLGLEATYELIELDIHNIEAKLDGFWQQGMLGLNVTHPLKSLVAKILGCEGKSINTLYRGETGWKATSTDGIGFAKAMKHQKIDFRALKDVVIIGGGGVVPALLTCFLEQTNIHVLTRRSFDSNCLNLQSSVINHKLSAKVLESLIIDKKTDTLLIHASSAPLFGDPLDYLCPAMKNFHGYFIDLNYSHHCALYNQASLQSLSYQDGLIMLIEQARASQMLWFNRTCDFQDMYHYLAGGSYE